jgi:hypothetical protein
MTRWMFAALASAGLIGAGLVHGYWTDRWTASSEVEDAAARLSRVPVDSFGDWDGSKGEIKPGQVGAGVAGCWQRRFVNHKTGQAVVVALVNGRPGPVATHTPEVCYGASGYAVGEKQAVRLDSESKARQFWTSIAVRTRGVEQTKLRLYWAWNGGDGWRASDDPRGQFSRFRYPVLHKLYVLRDLSNLPETPAARQDPNNPGRDDACEAFLEAFLPVLDRTLFDRNGG